MHTQYTHPMSEQYLSFSFSQSSSWRRKNDKLKQFNLIRDKNTFLSLVKYKNNEGKTIRLLKKEYIQII